ncbi:MAG: DNA polymerase I [Candidatus Omnitrophica bacterium]|nr:DNA polymerase I [Candidatus Omnitrophota bacterium]MDD5351892.1 DNA polymerase I [Candidatus Omnitrophota bacterium]MDD5550718.1 DNA polymerase I [Candidatus Omnitrophota bacterium]
MSRVCLIDAHSLCYRAFFAIKANLATSYGQPTNAVYGFINMLNKILSDVKPDYVAICFDVAKPTFREEKFKEYKIDRPSMPDDLKTQIPLIKEIISAYNIRIIEKEGFEADDLIATFASRAKKKNLEVTIVTSDKDMLQLVDSDIKVYNPYKEDGIYFSPKEVEEHFGVKPRNIVDLLSLMGDSTDNIPGAKGIGEKTARELLGEFKDIDGLFKNIDKIKSDKVKNLIKDNKKNIKLSQELVVLEKDVDIDIDLKDLSLKEADYEKLYALFSKLEFKTLLKSLSQKVTPMTFGKEIDFIKNIKQTQDLRQLESDLKNTKEFSFYIDISQEQPRTFIYAGKDKLYVLTDKDKLSSIFADKNLGKIGNDIKNAKLIFDKFGVDIRGGLFDIMIAAYLINPARTDYQIETLLYDYLNIGPFGKEDLKNQEAVFIYKLKEILDKELGDKNLSGLFYKLEIPLIGVLFRIEKNGIKLDCKLLADLSEKLDKELNKLMQEIFNISGREFNLNSPKQLREILFDELKLPIVKKTKTGPSTDEEVLNKLSLQHKIPQLILKYRQITKLKSTYVDVLPDLCDKKDHRIHSNFLQIGTETGRLSSNNPNLQNIPVKSELGREIRSAFIASSKDWSLFSCDYSQIELRMLAHLSKDEVLAKAFEQDLDIHKATAALIYGVDLKDVEDKMREVAKRVNFGVIYGMSAYGLSKDLDIGLDVAQDFIDTYFLRYPKVKVFIEGQIKLARDKGYVATIMGRRRYLPYINSKNIGLRQFSERQAVNATIQGSAADLIKLAMINIQEELDKKKMQTKMVIQVHDELVFDFPDDEKSQLVKIVKSGMEEAIKLDVPVKVSLKIGQNWAEMKEII